MADEPRQTRSASAEPRARGELVWHTPCVPEGVTTDRERAWTATMGGHEAAGIVRAHRDSHALAGVAPAAPRAAREAAEDAVLAPGATRALGAGRRQRGGGAGPVAHVLRARPGPHPARRGVPPAGRQDPGVRLPRRPPAHPAHPRARGGAGGRGVAPALGLNVALDRGHRPRPRLRARARRPRQRGRPRRPTSPAATTTPCGAPTSSSPRSTCAPRRSTASATTRGRRPGAGHAGGRGRLVGRPHRLRLPRLRGRRRRRHRHARRCCPTPWSSGCGRPAGAQLGAFIDAMVAAAAGHRPRSAWPRRGRGAGRVPPVQLRAHLPAPGVGRRRPTAVIAAAAGAGRALRRPAQPAPGRPPATGSRPAATRRCGPRSPTSAA